METLDSYVLMALVGVPFVWGILLAFLPGHRLQHIRVTSAAVAAVLMALTAYVFLVYDHEEGGFQLMREIAWLDSLGVAFSLGVDGISVPMVLLTGIVGLTGVLISWTIQERAKEFFVLFFLLVAGVYGVFVTLDLFFFFFFYELAVMPMYLLIGVWGSSSDFGSFLRPKEYGAMKLMLYLVAGSILVWVALLAVYVDGGIGSFNLLELREVTFSVEFQRIFFPLFMIGFGVLAGLWPFHTWSPDGHVAAPTAVSMLHAGVLMKLGAYGIIRVGIDLLPQGADDWMPVLIILGTINVVYGAVSAMGQRDLKYVIGYSSVSHMGYVLMGFATLNALGIERRGAADVLARHNDRPLLRTGGRDLRADARPRHRRAAGADQAHGADGGVLRRGGPHVAGAAGAERVRGGGDGVHRRVPGLSAAGRARHCGRGHNGRLHPAAAGQGVLRSV